MPAYVTIPNGDIDQDSPITQPLMTALRDNAIAMNEGDANAPVNAHNWHPYNKVTNNDANTGRIWSFAVDGAVTLITAPDFADGWDYAFLLDRVVGPGVASNFYIQYFRETSGAYAGAMNTQISSGGTGAAVTGFFEMPNVRLTRTAHLITGIATAHLLTDASTGAANINVNANTSHTTRQKILRARIGLLSGAAFGATDSAIYMLRRRNVMT